MNKWWLIPLLVLAGCSQGGQDTVPTSNCKALLLWESPMDTVDGSPFNVEQVEKFTIYVSKKADWEQENVTLIMDVSDKYLISWEMNNLPPGENYFYMSVTTNEGDISGYSNIKGKICT